MHAPEDAWFVEGFLLKALSLREGEVLVSSELDLGAVILKEIERGAVSPVTVVVVSPAFLASPWAQFANDLATHQSIEAARDGRATLVPAILADCALPLLSRFRVPLDFRDQSRTHWEDEAAKLRKKLATPAPVVAPVPCPYPGIRAFTTEDAARFHGRDNEVRELLGRLRDGQRELYVIGPSGSGKSSLVAAGLVPSLRNSPELAGGSFLVRQMRPGADPTATLAAVLEATAAERSDAATGWMSNAVGRLLANHPEHDRLLIVIDQLEELFTIANATTRVAFTAGVGALRGNARVALVLTLRADFYAQLMESSLWTGLDGQRLQFNVGPLRGDKLREAIETPARALGVYFEPVLVKQLLHDAADEPGVLPLLQDTLLDLWHRRARGLLRLKEYEAMSNDGQTGLAVTVARRADSALNDLLPNRREIARRVLLRLVQFGDGAATRRQQSRTALATAGDAPDDIDAVIRHLADQRLVTTSSGDAVDPSARVDLAHEVLLAAWPALGEWIRSQRDDEQRRRVLEAKAAEWVEYGRGQSRLLDADEIREVRSWLSDNKARELGVSEDIQSLLARSEAALAAQVVEAEARRRRWRRWVTVALVALTASVVTVSMLAVIAGRRSGEARDQARMADEKSRIADEKSSELKLQLARSSTLAAIAERRSQEAREQTRVADEKSRIADEKSSELKLQLARSYVWQGHGQLMSDHPAQAAPFLFSAREAGIEDVSLRTLFRWAIQGLPLWQLVHRGSVLAVAWSWDGTRIATASEDQTAQVWDARSGQPVTPLLAHRGRVSVVSWSPDGTQVATASDDKTARVWDARSGQPVTPPLAHQGCVRSVAWSPNGTQVATTSADKTARVWDAVSGQPMTPPLVHHGWVNAVAWSSDGTRVATASEDHTARVWDASTGQPVTPPLPHQGVVSALAWSPDGMWVATASEDHTARVWDARSGQPVTSSLAHQGWVSAVAFSPDGTRVATASMDKTARVWDVHRQQPVTPPFTHQGWVKAVAWSPDGTRVATASNDKTARVWDAVSGQPVTPPLAHQGGVWAVAWSPDSTRIVTASDDQTARVWNARSRQPVTPSLAHQGSVYAVAWSPDGTRVATASWDQTARVWDARSGQSVTPSLAHQGWVHAVAWSPDGTRVATTASNDQAARVWDAQSGDLVSPLLNHRGVVTAVAWSPDGTRIATASDDQTARVWDARSGQPVTPLLMHQGGVKAVAWSPDGTRVATASSKTARVWDARSGKPVTPPLTHQDLVWAVTWSPDGTRVATASFVQTVRMATARLDQTARVWDARSGQPVTPPLAHQGAAAWSPDGTRIATASDDQAARVWDARSGQPVTPPLTHQGAVRAVAWSPDGTRVATASDDQTARVWDARSGQLVTPPLTHRGGVTAVAWSPDGTRVATASDDQTARVWDVAGDTGTLADWRVTLQRCDYSLNALGVLVARDPMTQVLSPPSSRPPSYPN